MHVAIRRLLWCTQTQTGPWHINTRLVCRHHAIKRCMSSSPDWIIHLSIYLFICLSIYPERRSMTDGHIDTVRVPDPVILPAVGTTVPEARYYLNMRTCTAHVRTHRGAARPGPAIILISISFCQDSAPEIEQDLSRSVDTTGTVPSRAAAGGALGWPWSWSLLRWMESA